MDTQDKISENIKPVFVDVIQQLKNHLADKDAKYPYELVEKIIEQREHTTEKLLATVDDFFKQSIRDMSIAQEKEVVVTLAILAKLREKRAFEYAIRLLTIPHKTISNLLNAAIVALAGKLLASTFDGDWDALYTLVTNPHFHEHSRSGTLRAYTILYRHNIISREKILTLFAEFLEKFYDDFSFVPTALIRSCFDIHATELTEQIDLYFEEDIVDTKLIPYEAIEQHFALPRDKMLQALQMESFADYVHDIKEEIDWMFDPEACPEQGRRNPEDKYIEEEYEYNGEDEPFRFTPAIRATPKIGRNEKCPCGSGKKYKKCCLNI